MTRSPATSSLLNLQPAPGTFLDDVLHGLGDTPPHLPCKYFYDERGSRLFDEICELDEYYLTRTELSIMRRFAPEMARHVGTGVILIEFGSGSSVKTRILLDHLSDPVAYVPIDISLGHLQRTADGLSLDYSGIEVLPVCADFAAEFVLPKAKRPPAGRVVYFPGSTIGNFTPDAARAMMARIAALCGAGGGLLIGIDLQKDGRTIEAAYNDSRGVTAEFNLNLLRRINRELDGNFDLDQYKHHASYREKQGRVEMFLVSQCDQTVTIGEKSFEFVEGDALRTELCYKYTIDGFVGLAADAGLQLRRHWTDDQRRFGVLYLTVVD